MLTQKDGKRIAKKLQAETRPGRRHDLVIIRFQGKYVAQFGVQRGTRDANHNYIAKQLHVSAREASDLSECPMSAGQYFQRLIEKGLLEAPPN